jgi:hypothetical protein
MTINRLPDYLGHMRQAIADAQAFTEGMAQPDFEQDKRTQQAVVMSLIVLGEAATKVMDQHPEFAAEHAANSMAKHARHAQPHCTRLFRHRPCRGLGHVANSPAHTQSPAGTDTGQISAYPTVVA